MMLLLPAEAADSSWTPGTHIAACSSRTIPATATATATLRPAVGAPIPLWFQLAAAAARKAKIQARHLQCYYSLFFILIIIFI